MRTLVAVYFQNKSAQLSYWEDNQQCMISINLPGGINKDALVDESCFKKTFHFLNNYLLAKKSWNNISWVIGIPDSFGIKEKMRIFQYGTNSDIYIARLMSYSMAAALLISWKILNEKESEFWVVIDNGKDLEIGEYNSGDGVTDRISTYLFKDCRWEDLEQAKRYNLQTWFSFEISMLKKVYYIDIENSNGNLYQKHQFNSTNTPSPELLPASDIIKGLGFQCGKLSGQVGCGDILAFDTFTPYQVCFSVNQVMYDLLPSEQTIPLRRIVEICNDVEVNNNGMLIQLLERRGNRYIPQVEVLLDKDDEQLFLNKNLSISLDADANCNAYIVLQNEEGFQKSYPLNSHLFEHKNIKKKRE